METVFVAMSGGIDSSFTAYLLKKQGYKVVGITFQLLPETIKSPKNPKACCSLETMMRAKKIADDLSIPHYIINLRKEFEEHVIENFLKEYESGRTPNPCVLCNKYIKFLIFPDKAQSIGADKIATGHYAKIAKIDEVSGKCILKKGNDKSKDQSYFLYPIKKELLKYTLFPLGTYTKNGLRDHARTLGWSLANIKESQDVCFIPENDYREFLSHYLQLQKGPVYHADGKLIGTHEGIHMYTIGQRRGLNIPYQEPLYVVEIIADKNTLIVGPKEYLGRKRLIAQDVNFLLTEGHSLLSGNFTAKVRYRQKEEPCTLTISGDLVEIDFLDPVYSITPGQSAVVYSDDIVVCGGIIKSSN